jgi:hypothetical protein
VEASPGLTARKLGDLDDGPLRAGVAAWGNSARSGIGGELGYSELYGVGLANSPWLESSPGNL